MKKIVKSLFVIMLVGVISLFYGMVAAQTYPTKPIRIIVPFAPGGSNDIIGRQIAARLTERLGKQVIVENRGGAGAVIGMELVANSEPDGYTLLLSGNAYTIAPSLYKLPYDPVKAFVPVARLGTGPAVLTIHPSVPVNSVKELIALAKQKPGKLICASVGVGTFNHLGAELFKIMAGVDFMIVQFKGGGPAAADQLGGHSQIMFGSLTLAMPHIKSEKLKALGVGGLKRSAVLPNVPTIAEAGVPGYESSIWWGIHAPAGTPKTIVDRLDKELAVILTSPETQKMFHDQGAEVDYMGPEEFGKFISAETAKWARVVKEGNIKAE
ncbi:MAG: tripartite tricarboxylate transporter substrate binding protein [Proteobacteria bacterium]|nr:tripartite tricarboxylate transporter substrate binding protein [Pseudomonadota bacterium]MBU2228486.1 tripartite tricarboxylate transporter substrate binding protein [Pseudomonadota bacterium]MBU2261381.1 tripartite tricarboxylate transporter substrate binding protein [Pseudomonadota bacterium]